MTSEELDQLAINTIRTLSIDAVQQANSGHPGTPMALAPLVYVIWNEVMRFESARTQSGQIAIASSCRTATPTMLLWSVLYLTGTRAVSAQYERLGEPAVTLDDIRRFRQLGSKAPGHPEYHLVSGVEATTRSARSGHCHQRRHGHRPQMACKSLQQAGLRSLRLQHLCRLRRRLHDGRG